MRYTADSAAGHVLSVIIAGAILISGIGAVLFFATDPVDKETPRAAQQQAGAQDLIDMLVLEGTGWEVNPDAIDGRLGLMGPAGLDIDKMDLLSGALLDAAPNGRLDYAEARASLLGSAGDGLDFHLRIYPANLPATIQLADLSGIRTAYIGDWSSLPTTTTPLSLDQMTMVLGANNAMNATAPAGTLKERQLLRDLGLGYVDRIHITSTTPDARIQTTPLTTAHISTLVPQALRNGDVYPDQKQYLDAVLAPRLSQYKILFVGSGVDQNSMTSNIVKDSIRDWVYAGGTLIVLGTDKQNYQWLRPIFDAGVNTVNGAPHAPDTTHPLLRVPRELNWPHYDDHDRAWDIEIADEELFERVVLVGADEVLAVSREGAFGDGRLFLTTFEPRHIAAQLGDDEAAGLLNNIIVYSERDHLFLDYGPTVPDGVAASSAVAQTYLIDADLGFVPMRVEVLLWAS